MTDGERLEDIVEAAVARGDAPGVVAAVAKGDERGYTWEGGSGTACSNVPDLDTTVVVLTQRALDETGMPAVCDDVLSQAIASR